jgi:hypothetical protein
MTAMQTIKSGGKLLGAVAWLVCGVVGGLPFWLLLASPDADLVPFVQEGDTLNELRQIYLASLVFAALIGVNGFRKIRQWFRPAGTSEKITSSEGVRQ